MAVEYNVVNEIISDFYLQFHSQKWSKKNIADDKLLRHSTYIIQWLHRKIFMNISGEFQFSTSIKRIGTRVWSCMDNNNDSDNSIEWEKGTRLPFHNDNTDC